MAIDNKLARTGVFFVIENLCNSLLARDDIDLRIFSYPEYIKKLKLFYSNHEFQNCFKLEDLKFGEDKIYFIMPFHPADRELYKIKNSKIIQVIYDFSHHFCPELSSMDKAFEKKIINSINQNTYALCISNKTKQDLLSLTNMSEENVGIFYPALRNDLVSIKNLKKSKISIIKNYLNIPNNEKYILCLSTIEPRKNLISSLKIFEEIIIKKKVDDLYLVLSGAKGWGDPDSYLNKLPDLVKKKIKFTGYIHDKYISELYREAICLLYPSFYEGFGMPPLEAMSYGTPVVTSDRGSLPEIFGETAYIFDPYNIKGMSELITGLYLEFEKNKQEEDKLISFTKKFNWTNSSNQIVEFINKISF